MQNFHQIVSVNFQGTVVTFGRSISDDQGIYFNVLGTDVDVPDDRLSWTGFTKVEFTEQVRQVGMSLVTVATDAATMVPSIEPFRVVTDQQYISVVQQSQRGTLYVNRFRLLKTKSGTDQKTITYSLSPAWEVRYARSHNADIPADKSDKQSYLDPDGKPFLEPSLELSMIDGISGGRFDVVMLPISGTTRVAWQFLTLDAAGQVVRLFNFPSTDNGLFDVAGKPIGPDYRILPDSSFSVTRAGSPTPLMITEAPRIATYVKHEKVVQPDGTNIGVRRAARAMIALTVDDAGASATVTIDSAVGITGTIAKLEGNIETSNIVPAEMDLRFDGFSSLALVPPQGGPNPLAIKGPYEMRLLLAPGAKGDGVPVVGGAAGGDDKTLAPFVRIVDGDKIEVGFGNGTAAVRCRTLHQVLFTEVWTELRIQYAGAGTNLFTITVNGSVVPLTPCSTGAEPSGTPVALVGAASGGFVGALKTLVIAAGGTTAVDLACNSVNYQVTPPTTPNTAGSGVVATVAGAQLEPSASPVNSDVSGAFYIDAAGLTYYAGFASFIRARSPSCLYDGSDGLLHLYYQGDGDLLTVAQFSKESARATFTVGWTTSWPSAGASAAAYGAPEPAAQFRGRSTELWRPMARRLLAASDQTQSGFLNFVADRVGTYMNGTRIVVAPSSVSTLLCDITVDAPDSVGREVWRGLPRDVGQLSRIWNGAASNNPDDKDVLSQARPYFDYSGTAPAVLVPTKANANGSFFLFTSVPRLPVTLASVQLDAGQTSAQVTIRADVAAPPRWPSDAKLVQIWPEVAADPRAVLDTLAGKATRYDYATVQTPGSRAYGVPVIVTRSGDQVSYVVIFVRDEQKDFSITITEGSTPDLCNVEVCGIALPDVPRPQVEFARTLNGDNTGYTYPPGYVTGLATRIFALSNGLSTGVANTSGPPSNGGAFAYAGLLRVLYQGQSYDASGIATLPQTAATVIQGARLIFKDRDDAIPRSMLFGAVIESPPTDGGVGRIDDTIGYSGGQAPVLTPGVNGGWMPRPPRFSLGMNQKGKTNYVGFNVDKSYAASDWLAILSDLTVEAWLSLDDTTDNLSARALTYNVAGNRSHPDTPVRYMIGARQGPALAMGASTYASGSFNFKPPALTVQVYVYLPQSNLTGTILTVSEVRGSTEYLSLSVNQYGKAALTFLKQTTVQTATMLPVGAWVCLTAVVADAGAGQVTLKLAVNGDAPVTTSATNSFTGSLGALTLGSKVGTALRARFNGVAFWQRALSDTEVHNTYAYGFPDNDSMLGIRWNLAEGQGTKIVNSAVTGPEFDSTVINPANPSWSTSGVFRVPYAGRNDLVIASNRILKGWTHVALTSKQGYGLRLQGSNYGSVADGSNFNPSSSFALESWIAPASLNRKQVILEKPGSYSLYVNTLGQVCLTVQLQMDPLQYNLPPTYFTHDVKAALQAGATNYVAVNFSTGTVPDDSGSDQYVPQKYYARAALYINGVLAAENNVDDLTETAKIQTRTSSFFVGVAEEKTFYFEGLLSHVRIWNRNLSAAEITRTQELRLTPTSKDGLTASWDFDDMSGTTAQDLTGSNALVLTSNQLWTIWQDVAQASIVVDGRTSLPLRLTVAEVGGYEDLQLTIGAARQVGGSLSVPFKGGIDDVRLFSTRLTEQQIRESMNKELTGSEDNLAAYWTLSAGSGITIFDETGRGNNGTLLPASTPPVWQSSSAPIQNEAQYVVNALGGEVDYFVAQIAGEPSVIEYAGAERDAYGKIFSVMKRGYFYLSSDAQTELEVGYKVGDLDTIFVGQVQSNPTIIGYIEGGPPIPSENQTLAYWSGAQGGPATFYAGISSVTYQQSETKTWTFTGNKSSTYNGELNIKGGLYFNIENDISAGLGLEAGTKVLKSKITGGAKLKIGGTLGDGETVSQTHANTVNLSTTMAPPGNWEPEDAILNPTVGRRYIQNNTGIALVKSSTADLYMIALKGTQTPVGYVLAPNETIPIDTNIIDFPINPQYVKNGTLDGKVGLMNDPDYPEANDERGSYFKPLDAYSIKQKIDQQEQQLKAYYDQFETNKYRTIAAFDSLKDKLSSNPAFDFRNNKSLRSLYNNYVWTAAGGLHREEHSVANSYTETYVGNSSLTVAGGLDFKADIGTPFGGYYIEADTMQGNTWTMTATKAESVADGFLLNCITTPTNFLAAPRMSTGTDGRLQFDGYEAYAAPGKVDAYRYMAFLLAPGAENFAALSGVVDPNWLVNSTTAAAAAMRQAMANPSEPWRVLYRTTYVSRVPAPFQPVRDDTTAPNITPPANLASNHWLVTVVEEQIDKPDPTRVEIGAAIDKVLGSPSTGPGLLTELIPWWADFYAAAAVYGSDEFLELAELRVDLLEYMVSKYESDNYRAG